MKFQLAILSLFFGASAAFVPQQSMSRVVAYTRIGSTASPTEADAATDGSSDSGLSPEFQAAVEKAVATCTGVLKETQPELIEAASHFCTEYITASQRSNEKYPLDETSAMASLERILSGVKLAYTYGLGENVYEFGVTHDALRGDDEASEKIGSKLDFYKWGCEFFRHFMDSEDSLVLGEENLKKAMEQVANGENVIFYANHQSEADPQVMSICLEKMGFGEEASKIVYVAGHKVTTDALAIPFSMGRNLICIHSKKHIDADPETQPAKTRQNMRAMNGMLKKLKQGGTMIWVAPSGGRDRRDTATGKTPIAPFDSKTIDMFRLMGKKSKVKTHYYPLSMVSYELCPPPDFVEAGTGEQRNFRFVPVGIKVCPEVEGDSDEDINPGVFEATKKGYHELRERIFPGTSPGLE